MVFTCVVGWTQAGVVVDSVHAGGVVLAVVVLAVIGVCLAALALKTWRAHAATGTQTQRRHTAFRCPVLGLLHFRSSAFQYLVVQKNKRAFHAWHYNKIKF